MREIEPSNFQIRRRAIGMQIQDLQAAVELLEKGAQCLKDEIAHHRARMEREMWENYYRHRPFVHGRAAKTI